MKNDQRYFFIKVENYNRFQSLSIIYERMDHSFGPFRSKYTISEFLGRLKNIYPINKSNNRYEFEYHMFPITMNEETFLLNRAILLELFTNAESMLFFIKTLQSKLEEAANSLRYELASTYRDMINCFMMVKNGLDGYKNLISKNILITIPIETGYKLFYISNGNIINSRITETITKEIMDHFIEDCNLMLPEERISPENEKAWIDYRDVLYSEISEMPDEMMLSL